LQIRLGLKFFDWAEVEIMDILAAEPEKTTYILIITGR